MKKYTMQFCKLRKGNTTTYSWLSSKFTKVGGYVKLKDVGGWMVVSCGAPISSEIALFKRNAYKDLDSIRNTTNLG